MAINQLQHAHGLLVYPSDVYTLSYQFNSTTQSSNLYVGTGGNIRVLTAGGDDITFYNVQSGSFLPVHASKVFLTGTTASNILAMDMNLTGGGLNQETFAYLSATGITGDTEVSAINTLVSSLKLNGLWSKMKAVYPFVTDNRNLLGYTNNWTNAIWQGSSVTTGQADPFGGTNAILCSVEKWQSFSYTTLTQYTISIYAKANTSSIFTLGSDSTTNYYSTFNLSTQTVVNSTGYSGLITSIGNGWYRCSVTWTKDSGGALTQPFFDFKPTGGSMYFYGPQLELGSTATTYQPIATTQQSYISNQFKYNLVNPVDSDAAFRGVFNGGWTFSNQGALPNGTNGYMDTKLNPNGNLSVDSIALSYYSRTQSTSISGGAMGSGESSIGNVNYLAPYYNAVSSKFFVSGLYPANIASSSNSTTTGLVIGSKTAINSRKLYLNSTLLNTNSTSYSFAYANNSFYLGALNYGSPQYYSAFQCAFSSIGDGLTDSEATALYNAVQTFNSSLNRAVAP